MQTMYWSYDRNRYLSREKYLRHLSKKWLKEAGITPERALELAPHCDFDIESSECPERKQDKVETLTYKEAEKIHRKLRW